MFLIVFNHYAVTLWISKKSEKKKFVHDNGETNLLLEPIHLTLEMHIRSLIISLRSRAVKLRAPVSERP